MVAERATAPESAAPRSELTNQAKPITPEVTPATCGTCKAVESLYELGSGFLCVACIGAAVSMAANDIWPDMLHYNHAFEVRWLLSRARG